jgi:hypothetical protein
MIARGELFTIRSLALKRRGQQLGKALWARAATKAYRAESRRLGSVGLTTRDEAFSPAMGATHVASTHEAIRDAPAVRSKMKRRSRHISSIAHFTARLLKAIMFVSAFRTREFRAKASDYARSHDHLRRADSRSAMQMKDQSTALRALRVDACVAEPHLAFF